MVRTGRAFPLKNQWVSIVRRIPEPFAGLGLKNLLYTFCGYCLIHSNLLNPALPTVFWRFKAEKLFLVILKNHLTEIRGDVTG